MNYLWGALVLVIALFILVSAFRKSEFIVYRLLTARAKLMWKDNVHNFFKVVGIILIGVAVLFFIGFF